MDTIRELLSALGDVRRALASIQVDGFRYGGRVTFRFAGDLHRTGADGTPTISAIKRFERAGGENLEIEVSVEVGEDGHRTGASVVSAVAREVQSSAVLWTSGEVQANTSDDLPTVLRSVVRAAAVR